MVGMSSIYLFIASQKTFTLCPPYSPWNLAVCLQPWPKSRYPSASKSFPQTSPVRPSTRDATTLHSFLDSPSRTIPEQDPLSTSSTCWLSPSTYPHDPGPALSPDLAYQGHSAQSPGRPSQTLPPQNSPLPYLCPFLTSKFPVTPQVSA